MDKNNVLNDLADLIDKNRSKIIAGNTMDIENFDNIDQILSEGHTSSFLHISSIKSAP